MKDRKLLFFDVDGTLVVDTPYHLPKSTIEALNKAKENNHIIIINTGRSIGMLEQQIKDLPIDGYIGSCGAHIVYQDKELYHSTLDRDISNYLFDYASSHNIDYMATYNDKIYFPNDPIFHRASRLRNLTVQAEMSVESFSKDNTCDTFSMWFREKEWLDNLDTSMFHIDCIPHNRYFHEFTARGHSKASGVLFLANHLGIELSDCYVFGDSLNDLTMLQCVPNAIAMGNSPKELLKHASFVTKNVEDDGIEYALKHFQLI